jgi:Tol biopolymer transport system component
MRRSTFAIVAALFSLAIVEPCAAQSRVAFLRWVYNGDGSLNSSTLYRVNADGTGLMQLAPTSPNVYRFDPRWSPSGNTIVYQSSTGSANPKLWRMTATGGSRTQITTGTSYHSLPSWRPDGGLIAFTTQATPGASCLALVRPDGTGQRNLYCPTPSTVYFNARPVWSADGTRLFVSTWRRGTGLEPPYYMNAYSINVSTGTRTLLTSGMFEDGYRLLINPAGTQGLLDDGREISSINFATDAIVPRAEGTNPVWSQGGSRFAYQKTQFSGTDMYTHVWIMSADGTSDTEIPMPIADGLEYFPVEFSNDATRLLTDRSNASGVAMRLFNVASGTWVSLPVGSANDWFQP